MSAEDAPTDAPALAVQALDPPALAVLALDTPADEFRATVAAIGRIDAVATILEIVCRTTGMGFAAVARVTSDQWLTCAVHDEIEFGLVPGSELAVETTLCHEVRESGAAVVIDDVATDPIYADHPAPALYGFQSYISTPIVLRDGTFFGTLCAIDPGPAKLDTPATVGMFKMFAELIAFHLDANDRVVRSEAVLRDERTTAGLREQFIAILGHDLRNPLASIGSGVRLLRSAPPRDKFDRILSLMQGSVDRMASLIDNVLDLARGRLGGGLTVDRGEVDIDGVLTQIVEELRLVHPGHRIELTTRLPATIACDEVRIVQLISNLLGNALTHGDPAGPVLVHAESDATTFRLMVTNSGDRIKPVAMTRLFEPFVRGRDGMGGGLGLGLYIASEIARAHGGTLSATSTDELTVFTFIMPL